MMNDEHYELEHKADRPESKPVSPGRGLFPIAKLVQRNPHFLSEGRTRRLVYEAEPRLGAKGVIPGNGLAPAIVRIGRRVLIDEDMFYTWVNSHRVKDVGVAADKERDNGR